MKKSNNKTIIAGVALIAAGVVAFATSKKSNGEMIGNENFNDQAPAQPTPSNPTPAPVALNGNKVLKLGVNGAETKKLQQLLGVTADGIFGSLTESALFTQKGVKSTTLNTFASLTNMNQSPIAIGSNVMANNRSGTQLFDAVAKADGSYFSNYEVEGTVDYGQLVGKIKLRNATKTWYLVEVDTWVGTRLRFVKSADVVKI